MVRGLVFSIIFLLATAATIVSLSARPVGATVSEQRFSCQGGEQLLVGEQPNGAAVQIGNSTYQLSPRRSSLGRKFSSPQATLIIDGQFAAFVAGDRTNLRGCFARPA